MFDLNVEYFIGMPSWVAAGDPGYGTRVPASPRSPLDREAASAPIAYAVHTDVAFDPRQPHRARLRFETGQQLRGPGKR